ncbi:stonustoxin subunit alpha-like [Micropterus dolomieu]|uniref:stonustoxin subunit alpha-like n=1 Tax=Micropterus dolomieu TaxID=147949 RepID=UPI001E8DDEDA|nr:stonustoxin subunit alpha-like [Micropterus dolomieu]
MTSVDLLNTLEDLSDEEFKKFKWSLKQPVLEGYQPVKASKLEKADRPDTVDLMLNTYKPDGALKVTKKVLEEIPRNDLVQSLTDTISGPEEEALLKTLPEAKASNTALVSVSNLSERSCEALSSSLRELDPSSNNQQKVEEGRRVEPAGVRWLRPGLRKYSCELTIDTNTVSKWIKLSDNNRKAMRVEEDQSYPDHPERFGRCQLLCTDGLTGRCYWEVEWRRGVSISVNYRGIRRRGAKEECVFGMNDQSWSLSCSDDSRYSVRHNNVTIPTSYSSSSSSRVAVYVDCPAGSLSFFRVSSDTLIHLHTFNTTFTEPLYPGFGFWPGSSVSLCSV